MPLSKRDLDEIQFRVKAGVQEGVKSLTTDVERLKDSMYGVEGGKEGVEVRVDNQDKFNVGVKTVLWAIVPGANALFILLVEFGKSLFKKGG